MGQPQDRQWTVDLRARAEDGSLFYDEDFAQQRTAEAFLDLATIQHREGGIFTVGPIRQQVEASPDALSDEPVWVNLGLLVEHKFAPPVRSRVENGQAVVTIPEAGPNPGLVEGDEPSGVIPQAPDPMADVDAERSRMEPLATADLIPKVQ